MVEVLLVALRLGLTSFGGPLAHLGYFQKEYVDKRRWLDEPAYLELVALCQVLPGPTSSQVGIAVGTLRAGLLGGILAWVGFTLPSAVLLTGFALLANPLDAASGPWVHGLKLVALAVVFQAVLSLGRSLITGPTAAALALASMAFVLAADSAAGQVGAIVLAGLLGAVVPPPPLKAAPPELPIRHSRAVGLACLLLFALLLVLLPLVSLALDHPLAGLADALYRSGALVFGGGHVVLPLLEKELVTPGLISPSAFLAGYGAAQTVPGPLFTVAAYLGAFGWGPIGALVGTVAIFLPGSLLTIGVLPFWRALRRSPRMLGSLKGIQASVVGILGAALYDPLWTSAVRQPLDLGLALVLVLVLVVWKGPPWAAVALGVAGSLLLGLGESSSGFFAPG